MNQAQKNQHLFSNGTSNDFWHWDLLVRTSYPQPGSNAAFATSKFLNMWAEQGGWQEELSELQQTNVRSCFVQSARWKKSPQNQKFSKNSILPNAAPAPVVGPAPAPPAPCRCSLLLFLRWAFRCGTVKSSSAPNLPSHRSRSLIKVLQCSSTAITTVCSGHVQSKILLVVPQKSSQAIKTPDSPRWSLFAWSDFVHVMLA